MKFILFTLIFFAFGFGYKDFEYKEIEHDGYVYFKVKNLSNSNVQCKAIYSIKGIKKEHSFKIIPRLSSRWRKKHGDLSLNCYKVNNK